MGREVIRSSESFVPPLRWKLAKAKTRKVKQHFDVFMFSGLFFSQMMITPTFLLALFLKTDKQTNKDE